MEDNVLSYNEDVIVDVDVCIQPQPTMDVDVVATRQIKLTLRKLNVKVLMNNV